ncbi:MAG: hypothetical protein ACE5G0_06720 [Rhodothermales bacterium]
MTVSVSFLTIIVLTALAASALAPIVFLFFLIRDWRRGELW